MKILALIFLFMTFTLPQISRAQIFVGNAGEGLAYKDHIFLRDLVESNVHSHPYFGQETSERITELEWMLAKTKGLGIDLDLLKRKLSDAEYLKSGLGVFLVHAIYNYSWSFIPDLEVLPDTTPLLSPEMDDAPVIRVPLARRFKGTIKVHATNFARLSPEHRVALVIHEALYSLVRVQPEPNKPSTDCKENPCGQPSFDARSFTGMLFDSFSYDCPLQRGNCLGRYYESLLDIDWNAGYFLYRSTVELYMPQGNSKSLIQKVELRPGMHFYGEDLYRLTQEFCQEVFVKNPTAKFNGLPVVLEMKRSSFIFEMTPYMSTHSNLVDKFQLAAKISSRKPLCAESYVFPTLGQCSGILANAIKDWFDPSLQARDLDSCKVRR